MCYRGSIGFIVGVGRRGVFCRFEERFEEVFVLLFFVYKIKFFKYRGCE